MFNRYQNDNDGRAFYNSVCLNGWYYLCVTVNGKSYFLGRTGKAGDCHNPSQMMGK